MKQSAFTIVTELVPHRSGGTTDLEAFLNEIGDDIAGNPHLRFSDLSGLHYASFCLVSTGPHAPFLLFEGNVDGPVEPFLRQLVENARTPLDRIYGYCAGYPPPAERSNDAVLAYLLRHDLGTNTFYVAWPGWTVEEIRREQRLRDRIGELLDEFELGGSGDSATAVHRWIRERVSQDPELRWARTPASRPFLVRQGNKVVLAGAAPLAIGLLALVRTAAGVGTSRRAGARATLAALGTIVAATAVRLRMAEAADDRRDQARDPDWRTAYARWSDNLDEIRYREDRQLQNHMISVVAIKPGRFRSTTLRLVLRIIDAAARLTANKGSLGGIPTIHFARWVITEDGTRLIFLSNFDGSWDRYLTDFIDRASYGLTAVWTHTDNDVGFPRTRWLVKEGARHEARFKAYARYSMTPTQVWYSAYPRTSVDNIANNMRIRKDLFAPLDEVAAQAWVRQL